MFLGNVTPFFQISGVFEEKLSFALGSVTPVLHPCNGALQVLLGLSRVVAEVCGRAGP